MTHVDARLAVLRARLREWGEQLRPLALEIDRDPEAIRHHFDLPAVRHLATMGIPAAYGHEPEKIDGHRFYGDSALERAVVMEELACADVGTLVASPGPLLAGVAVGLFADEAQKKWFYGRMLSEPLWTCFALTEPDGGSDAAALRSTLTRTADGALLSGEKRYVGNASRTVPSALTRKARVTVPSTFAASACGGYSGLRQDLKFTTGSVVTLSGIAAKGLTGAVWVQPASRASPNAGRAAFQRGWARVRNSGLLRDIPSPSLAAPIGCLVAAVHVDPPGVPGGSFMPLV